MMMRAWIVMLCLVGPISMVFADEGGLEAPVRGLHIMSSGHNDVALCERFIREALPKEGINTLVMELDYDFQFRSHPELSNKDAMDRNDVERLAKACRDSGVKLIPELNCLGHQSWGKYTGALLLKYPQFDETPSLVTDSPHIYCRSWCPLAPGLHEIVFDLIDELADACGSDAVHCGMDEVFLIADPNCPRCRGKDPAQLFADEVTRFHDHLKAKGRTMWMWGDRFLDANAYPGIGKWEASIVGTAPAVDKVPKDIVICDWHYEKAWPTPEFFAKKGFRVVACPWRQSDVALAQLAMIRQTKGLGMLQTTWVSFPDFAQAYFRGEPAPSGVPPVSPKKSVGESVRCFRDLCAAMRGETAH
jgi:hypothetical protein